MKIYRDEDLAQKTFLPRNKTERASTGCRVGVDKIFVDLSDAMKLFWHPIIIVWSTKISLLLFMKVVLLDHSLFVLSSQQIQQVNIWCMTKQQEDGFILFLDSMIFIDRFCK